MKSDHHVRLLTTKKKKVIGPQLIVHAHAAEYSIRTIKAVKRCLLIMLDDKVIKRIIRAG